MHTFAPDWTIDIHYCMVYLNICSEDQNYVARGVTYTHTHTHMYTHTHAHTHTHTHKGDTTLNKWLPGEFIFFY